MIPADGPTPRKEILDRVAESSGFARGTAARALDRLRNEGFVERRQGALFGRPSEMFYRRAEGGDGGRAAAD